VDLPASHSCSVAIRAIKENDWAYMLHTDQSKVLCDMKKDPLQFVNQANNPEYSNQLKQLRSRLEERLQEVGNSEIVDDNFGKDKK
jgi:hypothetical protein